LLIVFDLDDTIIDTSGSVTPYKLRECLKFLKRRNIQIGSLERSFREMQSLDQRCISSKESVRLILERFQASHLYEEVLALYSEPLPKNFIIPTTPDAKNVLHILGQRGHTLVLLTGGKKAFQLEKLEKAGLEPAMFSKIAVSEDSQKKSHYEALLKEFSKPPYECYTVGDRISLDLAPAHDLGWRTVHMRWGRGKIGKREGWIDYSICKLSEILEIL
jgi:putative hydrolase of the HAD superfamily